MLFNPSIKPFDNLLSFGWSYLFFGIVNESFIVINELMISFFQVNNVLPTSLNCSKEEDKNESINSSNICCSVKLSIFAR